MVSTENRLASKAEPIIFVPERNIFQSNGAKTLLIEESGGKVVHPQPSALEMIAKSVA